jgi:hypothetical protein
MGIESLKRLERRKKKKGIESCSIPAYIPIRHIDLRHLYHDANPRLRKTFPLIHLMSDLILPLHPAHLWDREAVVNGQNIVKTA